MALPLALMALLGAGAGGGFGALMGGGKGALLGAGLGGLGGYGIPALTGAGAAGASAGPTLGPGLTEMAGAATPAGVGAATVVPAPSGGKMSNLGLGASTISPIAGAMLGKPPQQFPEARPTNVGEKSPFQVDNFYPPPRQRMPRSLASLLMGIR